MSLLDEAKKVKIVSGRGVGIKSKFPLEDRLDLVLAYLNGEITNKQGAQAMNLESRNFNSVANSVIAVAYRQGLIEIKKTNKKK